MRGPPTTLRSLLLRVLACLWAVQYACSADTSTAAPIHTVPTDDPLVIEASKVCLAPYELGSIIYVYECSPGCVYLTVRRRDNQQCLRAGSLLAQVLREGRCASLVQAEGYQNRFGSGRPSSPAIFSFFPFPSPLVLAAFGDKVLSGSHVGQPPGGGR